MTRYGDTVVAVPRRLLSSFKRNPAAALLQFGAMPQRANSPFFTDLEAIDRSMVLPDVVVGPRADQADLEPSLPDGWPQPRRLVARDAETLLAGLAPTFYAPPDGSFWHLAYDIALNTGGAEAKTDRAGVALGRIGHRELDRSTRTVLRTYEVVLAAQIVASPGGQIILGALARFALLLKTRRGFNITSFSADQFGSADAAQQLVQAGLVTAGMRVDEDSGEIVGTPKPFSVDRSPGPYREVLEAAADDRLLLPRYGVLRREMRALEQPNPGRAPDHPKPAGPLRSKDVSDAVASCVGYLAAFGHAVLVRAGEEPVIDRSDLEDQGLVDPADTVVPDGMEPMGDYEDLALD